MCVFNVPCLQVILDAAAYARFTVGRKLGWEGMCSVRQRQAHKLVSTSGAVLMLYAVRTAVRSDLVRVPSFRVEKCGYTW